MPNRQQQMRFSSNAPPTPTTTTSIELIDNSQGKRGSTSDSIANLTTSQSAAKLNTPIVAGDESKDNQRQQCPQAAVVLSTNENHHSSPPHLNGVNNNIVTQDYSTSSNGVAGDANQQQITTIDPDRECRTGEICSGVSDGVQQAQQQHDGEHKL